MTPERIHPHPKMWKEGVSGEYRIQARKRGGVRLYFRGQVIFEAPNSKIAKMFAARHAAGHIGADHPENISK